MRFTLLALLLCAPLLLDGCAGNTTPTTDALRRQLRSLTDQQRASFESAGDMTSIAPTPDSGGSIYGDPTCDRSTCLPR